MKKTRRFFLDEIARYDRDNKLHITGKEAHHMINVLRLKINDRVILIDGKGWEAVFKIINIGKKEVTLEFEKNISPLTLPTNVHIAVSILKKSPMDWMVEKLTEIGVKTLTPLLMERTVVRLSEEKLARHLRRWKTISRQSLKQCRLSFEMKINPVVGVKKFLKEISTKPSAKKFLLWEDEQDTKLSKILIDKKSELADKEIIIVVGPEGGISKEELELFNKNGFLAVTLGPQILRAETAAMTSAALCSFILST